MLRYLPIVLLRLAATDWADAETVTLQNGKAVDLTAFACQDITRSSIVNRVCYDVANGVMIVQANAVYVRYCDVPEAVRASLLDAPSVGQYYKAIIKGSGAQSPYQCESKASRSTGPFTVDKRDRRPTLHPVPQAKIRALTLLRACAVCGDRKSHQ